MYSTDGRGQSIEDYAASHSFEWRLRMTVARQPSFTVILSRSIYLCLFICRFSPPPQHRCIFVVNAIKELSEVWQAWLFNSVTVISCWTEFFCIIITVILMSEVGTWPLLDDYIHCVSKKVPTLKLSVTLSNLKPIFKILHCWKAYEICYKTYKILPISPHWILNFPR